MFSIEDLRTLDWPGLDKASSFLQGWDIIYREMPLSGAGTKKPIAR